MNLIELLESNPGINITINARQLIEAVNYYVNKARKEETAVPENISGCRAAVDFLNKAGYRISLSLIQKETAAGTIPCRKFHNRHLVFDSGEILEWAEKNCENIGDMSAITLAVASSANNKLRRKKN
jgi:hypothetical protein